MVPWINSLDAANPAFPPPAPLLNDPVAGQALAKDLRDSRPAAAEFKGTLLVRKRDGTTTSFTLRTQILLGENGWDSSYEVVQSNRVENLLVSHAPGKANVYRYSSSTAGTTNLPPVTEDIWRPFANSDLMLADLGLEFFHWPKQVLVENEYRKNRACHVLESHPAVTNVYARVRSWVDTETGGMVMAEAYDPAGKRVKEFEVKRFKQAGDQWQLHEMEVRGVKERSRTTLIFDVPER